MNKKLKLNQNKIIEGYLNLAKSKLTKFNGSITGKNIKTFKCNKKRI